MGNINMARVVLGGLAAGLLINIGDVALNEFILARDWEAAMQALNREVAGTNSFLSSVPASTVLGIVIVWIYAAIRPRFGPGVRTAVTSGVLVWFLSYVYTGLGWIELDILPKKLFLVSILFGLIELPVAALLGSWIYREE
jgi:hypothetical protein